MARLLLHSGARAAHFVAALIFACSVSLADVVERSPDNNDNLRAFIGGQFAAYLAGTAAGFIPEPVISLTGEGVALATDISLKFTPPVFGRIGDKSLDTTLSSCYREFTLRQIEAQHKNFFGFNTVLVPEERRGSRVVDPGAWGPLVNTGEMEVLHQNSDVVVSLSGATIDPDATYPRTIRLPEGSHQFSWQAETQLAPVLDIAVPISIYAFFIYSELKAGSAFSKFFADRAVLKEIIDNPLNARYVDDAVAASIRGDIAKKLLQRFAPDRLDLAAYGIDLAEQGAAVGSLSVPDFGIATARNSFAQNVIVRDSHAPTIATTQPTLTLEATDLGGTRLVRVYDDLIASLDYSDPCDRELRLYSDAPNILPMGTTTIEWTVTDLQPQEDEAVYYAPGVSSTASVTQTVVVQDTQPPIVVAPAGKVIESTATQIDPADLDLGWPLVIDLADPAPIISNDAPPAFPNDSRVAVNWTATDSSGNAATKVQWVTGKTSGSNSAPTVVDTTADTRTAELVEIRLDGIDRDVLPTSRGVDLADPLAFEIVDYPDEGQFEAPLRPFFIEDFRLTPVGETDVKGVRTSPLGDLAAGFAALPDPADPRPANEQRAAYLRENYCDQGLAIPLDFVFQPTYVHVVDDGTYYVRDKFWDCNYPDFPGERISKWSQDRELLGEFRLGALDGQQSDVFTVDRDSSIWWTDSGPDVSTFLSAQDLNRIDANLGNYEVTRFAVQPEVVGFEYGITAVHGDPASDLIYVNTNVHIEVYRLGTLELLGRLNVDGNEEFLHPLFGRSASNCQQRELVFDGASSRRYWMTTDSAGNLYMSDACEDLIHKFGPSAVNADGEFVAGPYVGWMGRCDANVPPWNGCNEQRGVTRGFTCADSKCVRSQTFGAAPGQFEQPTHLAMGPEDILYVADFLNLRVQRFGADGTFAGEAKSTGTGVNVGDDPGFVLGNMGKPKAISVNSSTFYVMEAENDADFFLHSFKTIPFHMIEAGPGETDRDGDGYADNSVLLKYRSDYNFPGSSGRSVATDRFTYRVNDGLASSAVAQGNIRVRRTFRPPEQLAIRCYAPNEPATQVACALDEDTSLIVELVAEDPDGVVGYDGLDTLTYSIVRHPRFGSLTLRSVDAGSAFYLYRPDADANGTDNFRYSVSDGTTIRQGRVVEVEERFELTVVPVPDPPVLNIDPVATAGRGFPATVTATYTDVDNDPNEPEPVVYVAWGDGRGEAQGEIVETGDNEYDMTGPVLTPTVPGSGSIVASHVYGVNGTPNMIVCLESVDSALPICQTLQHDVVDATKTTAVLAVTEPQPPVGSVFSASLELTNQTPEGWAGLVAPSVRAALRIPTGLAIVAADPRCASGATGVLLCAVGDLAPGESTSIEYQLRARLDVVPVPSYELHAEIEHDAIDVADKIEASADVQVVWIDTDEDGLPDAWELLQFAALRATAEEDADGDGLSNIEEYLATADPRLVDTDNDDKPDAEEVQRYFTNPASADTDVDGLPDGWEIDRGTNVYRDDALDDPDDDDLSNAEEYRRGTEPTKADTDDDEWLDSRDNCPLRFNDGQADADADGHGDACDDFYVVGLVTIDDANANGTDDLAMLWTAVDRDGARSNWIQVTDGGSGAVLSRRTVLDGTQIPLELLALPSNPRQGGPRLVIASQRDSDGWPSLTIVDARSSRIYVQTNSLPLDSRLLATRVLPTRAIPRTERLALLMRNLTTDELRIHVLDASSGAELDTHALLGNTSPASSPTGLATLEIDATDGVAAFTGRSRDGSVPAGIEVVRIADGAVIASLSPERTGFAAMEIRAVADQRGDGVDDLAIRMRSPADGLEVVQLVDLPTTSVLSTITVLSPSAASRTNGAGVFQFDVLTVGGRPAVAALTAIDGGLVVTVYDLYTGSPLHETPFSGAPQAYRNHFSTLGPESGKAVALAVVLENTATAQHSIEMRDIETGAMTTVLEVGGSKPGGTGATGLWSLVFLSLVALEVARARRCAAARHTPPAVTRRLPERACREVVSADRQPE